MKKKMVKENKHVYYTYLIENVKSKRYYIGCRACPSYKTPEQDLGHTYFSSSTDKQFIENQKLHPKNFRYTVLKVFDSKDMAMREEALLHEKYNVGENPKFYNKVTQWMSSDIWCSDPEYQGFFRQTEKPKYLVTPEIKKKLGLE